MNSGRILLFVILIAGASIQLNAQSQTQSETQTQAQAQGRFPVQAHAPAQTHPAVQHITCGIGYTNSQCRARTDLLRAVLQKYPIRALGEWTWVLIRSNDWKKALSDRLFSENAPALTYLPARETYFDEALLLDSSVRGVELSAAWHMSIPALLDLAIRHEMGHALCNDPDERVAQRTAVLLHSGAPPACAGRTLPAHPSFPTITSKTP